MMRMATSDDNDDKDVLNAAIQALYGGEVAAPASAETTQARIQALVSSSSCNGAISGVTV